MRKTLIALLLLSAACATKRPVGPPLTVIPQAAVDSMCTRLRAEGMSGELLILKETRPVITPASLHALGEISLQNNRATSDDLRSLMKLTPVVVETPKTCAARLITPVEASRIRDMMTLEFSAPMANPFVKGQTGTLVRMSLGGESATWYWVSLIYHGAQWVAGMPSPLSVME